MRLAGGRCARAGTDLWVPFLGVRDGDDELVRRGRAPRPIASSSSGLTTVAARRPSTSGARRRPSTRVSPDTRRNGDSPRSGTCCLRSSRSGPIPVTRASRRPSRPSVARRRRRPARRCSRAALTARNVYILGISAEQADVSAALVRDGELVAALEEERFTRVKHCRGFPVEAVRRCLQIAGIRAEEIDCVAVSGDPRSHLARRALVALGRPSPRGLRRRVGAVATGRGLGGRVARALGVPLESLPALHRVEHHAAHLASAYYVSPFGSAALCSADGFGDLVGATMAEGRENRLRVLRRVYFPTRSASSTAPSRGTWASGGTATSTKSWASRPLARPSTSASSRDWCRSPQAAPSVSTGRTSGPGRSGTRAAAVEPARGRGSADCTARSSRSCSARRGRLKRSLRAPCGRCVLPAARLRTGRAPCARWRVGS